MELLKDRLALAMKGPPRVTGADLARACKIKPPSVSDWLSGETRAIKGKNLLAASQLLGVNAEWLASGRGPMRRDVAHGDHATPVASAEKPTSHVRFPLLEGFAGMGRGDYVGEYPEVVDFIEVTREWASQKLRNVPHDAVRVITGRGQSMRGTYNDGDLIFVDTRVKQFDGDSAYCYRFDGLVQIKRLQSIGGGRVRILSKNPDYPVIDVLITELEIGGRALAAWTLKEF